MSIERILRDRALVDKIARKLQQQADATAGLPVARLLEVAESARRGKESTLSATEEAIIRREGRPVFFVRDDRIDDPEGGAWQCRIDPARERLQARLRSVGRIDLCRHPKRKWAGTGWLVAQDVLVTNRHVVREFGGTVGGEFVLDLDPFDRPVQVTVDFCREFERAEERTFRVERVLHVEEGAGKPDVALLKVSRRGTQETEQGRPIELLETDPAPGTLVGVVGYAARDGQRNEEAVMREIFGEVFEVKRFQPGEVIASTGRDLTHDCSTLGGNSGSVVLDFETGRAAGLHYAGFYEDENFAVKASVLSELLHRLKILSGTAI